MARNSSTDEQLCRAIIHDLIGKGIKLLSFDFDMTLISIHTGGAWKGSIHQLAQHFRPSFKGLLEAALERSDIHVCIVTLSPQQDKIADVLRIVLPKCDTSRILIRTSPKDWIQKNQQSKQNLGKQPHIAQVTTDLYNHCRAVIQPHEILLLDDDDENVKIAKRFGHFGFVVREDVALDDIHDFVSNMQESGAATYSNTYNRLPEHFVSTVPGSKYDPSEHRSMAMQRGHSYSASVYLGSSHAELPSHRQEASVVEVPRSASFTIPRPTVTNGSRKSNIQVDMRARQHDFDASQPHSATYLVMTNGR